MRKLIVFVRRGLEHRWLPVGLAFLAMALCSPALRFGWFLDDYVHQVTLEAPDQLSEMARSPLDLFSWTGENWAAPSETNPWWASEELRLAFFRPLTSFTHWLDYQLWPEEAKWMHLQSLVWLGLTVFAAAWLFRLLAVPGGAWIAGLAGFFFALEDGHGVPAVWIANRNALLAMFFGLLALIAYRRWRWGGWHLGAYLAPTFLLLALLSGEAGVACGGYLLSYGLFLDRGTLRQRLLPLVPCALVGIFWRIVYQALGYGAAGSGFYIDPSTEPWRFLRAALERGPMLLWGQVGFPPGSIVNYLSESAARQALLVVAFLLLLFGLILVPLLRRDARARFWALGMVLAVLPSCSAPPDQRLLFYASLGSAGLLATFIAEAWRPLDHLMDGWAVAGWRWAIRLVTLPLLLIHLVQAPVGLWGTTKNLSVLKARFARAVESLSSEPKVQERQFVILNAPSTLFTTQAVFYQVQNGGSIPSDTLTLATSIYSIEIHRPGQRSLTVRPHGGFLAPRGSAPAGVESLALNPMYIFQALDSVHRGSEPFRVGQLIERRGVLVEIVAVTDTGRPDTVTFHFDSDLEEVSWLFLHWEQGQFVEWEVIDVGATINLPAPGW